MVLDGKSVLDRFENSQKVYDEKSRYVSEHLRIWRELTKAEKQLSGLGVVKDNAVLDRAKSRESWKT